MPITDIVRAITQGEIDHTTSWKFTPPKTILTITATIGPNDTEVDIRIFLRFLEAHYSEILNADIVERGPIVEILSNHPHTNFWGEASQPRRRLRLQVKFSDVPADLTAEEAEDSEGSDGNQQAEGPSPKERNKQNRPDFEEDKQTNTLG